MKINNLSTKYDTVLDNPDTIEYNGKTYERVQAGDYTVGKVGEEVIQLKSNLSTVTGTDDTIGTVAKQDKECDPISTN